MTLTLIRSAPFARGERVINRERPEEGWVVVSGCVSNGQCWMVAYQNGAAPADRFVQCPVNWQDFPERPWGELDHALNVLRRDGRPSWAAQEFVNAARRRDLESGFVKRQLAFYRETLAPWWATYAAMVNPELGREQAAGIAKMADLLEEEARAEAQKLGIAF